MEPMKDDELRDLLRQWEAPAAPPHLERRIFGDGRPPKEPWYRWLLTGSIRIPVPAFLLLLLVLSALTYLLPRQTQVPPGVARAVTLSDFRPVKEMKPRIIRGVYESN